MDNRELELMTSNFQEVKEELNAIKKLLIQYLVEKKLGKMEENE